MKPVRYPDTSVKIHDRIVKRTNIITTDMYVYSVWEPSAVMGRHSTITTFDGVWFGQIGTRPLPANIESLSGPKRYEAVKAFHAAQYQEAHALIREVFPEAREGRTFMGEIELHAPL